MFGKIVWIKKKITYSSTDENSAQNLFGAINKNEQNRFDTNFKLNDYDISSFEKYILENELSATYNGKDYHFIIIHTKVKCDIILWYFEKSDAEIIIEYSLRDLTQNLILDFK